MKKIISLLLVLVLAFSLVGCGKDTEKKPEPNQQNQEQNTDQAALKVGVFYYNFADIYISTVRNELDKMLTDLGVEYKNFDAAANQATQTDAIKTAVASGTNLLLVNIVETSSEDAAKEIVNIAKEANIPVVFFNREVSDDAVKSYEKAAFVGTDAPEAGHLQGELIADFLKANYEKVDLNGDGQISYVMFKGQESNQEAEARTKFAVEDSDKLLQEAGKKPLVYFDPNATTKYLVDKDGNWSATAANDYMSNILSHFSEQANNMVEIVIANNDDMALGALSALQNAGYNKEGGKYIPIFGVDATETAQQKIQAGEMTGTVKQDNVGMASTLTALVKNVKEGKNLMDDTSNFNVDEGVAKIRVPYQKWTKDNH